MQAPTQAPTRSPPTTTSRSKNARRGSAKQPGLYPPLPGQTRKRRGSGARSEA